MSHRSSRERSRKGDANDPEHESREQTSEDERDSTESGRMDGVARSAGARATAGRVASVQRSATGRRDSAERKGGGSRSGYVSYDPGPDRQAIGERYGIDVREGQARTLQRLESEFGSERVSRWAEEGMTVRTMGKPRDMQAFRKRQEKRPEEVPTDIERRNEASLQRNAAQDREDGPAGDAGVPDVVRSVVSSPGRPMDETVQREMEAKMGGGFSDVQLHTGPKAAAAADSINARAFTVGNHIAFNKGEYQPESSEGQHVLAHELTHVRQQTDGAVSMLPKAEANLAIDPDPGLEREAEETSREVTAEPRTVRRLGTEIHVQPKLEVSSPRDPAEREAERVAEQVMSMPEPMSREQFEEEANAAGVSTVEGVFSRVHPMLDRNSMSVELPSVDRIGMATPDINRRQQGGEVGSISNDVERRIQSKKGGGHSMSDSLRSFFEPRFGWDFGDVRIHTDREANRLTRSLGARAFTSGNDIFFRSGEYQPNSKGSKELIAHELTHTVQNEKSSTNPTQQQPLRILNTSITEHHQLPRREQREASDESNGKRIQDRGPQKTQAKNPLIIGSPEAPNRIFRWDVRERHGFRGGTGKGIAEKYNYKPNPDDPWTEGGINYVQAAPTYSNPPQRTLPGIEFGQFQEPLSAIDEDTGEKTGLPLTSTVEKANLAIDHLQDVSKNVMSTYTSTTKAVMSYNNAQDDVEFGPYSAGEGLNWQMPEDEGKMIDVGELAEQQTPHGGSVSIGELFSGTGGKKGEDQLTSAPEGGEEKISDETISSAKTEEVSEALEQARQKDADLKRQLNSYRDHLKNQIPNAHANLENAYDNLTIKETEQEKERAQRKKQALEREKKEAKSIISGMEDTANGVSKALSGDITEAASMTLGVVAERVIDGQYKEQIRAQKGKIAQAKGKIRSLERDVLEENIGIAERNLNSAYNELERLEGKVGKVLEKREDAYDKAAEVAGSTAKKEGASGEQSNRIRTAIAAIPRIQKVLSEIDRVLQKAEVPTYDPKAGLAFAVAKKTGQGMNPQALLEPIGVIKSYKQQFQQKRTKWKQRFEAVKEIGKSLNVEGT